MAIRAQPEMVCYCCGLPTSGRPTQFQVAEEERPFCWLGCFLTYLVIGRRGPAGRSALLLGRLLASAVPAMLVMVISWASYTEGFLGRPASAAAQNAVIHRFYLPLLGSMVVLLLGLPLAARALDDLRQYRFGVETLVTVGAFSAYALSLSSSVAGQGPVYYDTVSAVLVLVTLGRYLEVVATTRTTARLRSLLDLRPPQAHRVRGGREEQVPAEELCAGELVRVRPGETFPADGRVKRGEGAVSESALTGEAQADFKRPGAGVYAGTSSVDGTFLVETLAVGEETVLGRIDRLLKEAQAQRPRIMRIADAVAARLIPVILLLALAASLYWNAQAGPTRGLMVALSVLLIACPCALGIAAPLAVWTGLGQTAARGILVRSGEVLERLGTATHLFFDKTGTLTTGEMVLTNLDIADGRSPTGNSDFASRSEILRWAASLETMSEHPVGRALVHGASEAGIATRSVHDFRAHPGLGVTGRPDGRQVSMFLGSRRFMERQGISIDTNLRRRATLDGETQVFLGWGGKARATFALTEGVRQEAREAIMALRDLGLRVAVVTGDDGPAVERMAEGVGIEDVRWGLLPTDKVNQVKATQSAGERVMMVGDGVNDGAALAAADVGIAMGCGTDLAREAAHVNLYGTDLSQIPWLVAFARRVRRTIHQNLAWAFLYNLVGIPLALTGQLTPIVAALAMVASSLLVMVNSLRLQRWESKNGTKS